MVVRFLAILLLVSMHLLSCSGAKKGVFRHVYPVYELDQPPTFPGGEVALLKYLAETIQLDTNKTESPNCLLFRVHFIVKKTGQVRSLRIEPAQASGSPNVNRAAIKKTLHKMPRWEPGVKEGVPVTSELALALRILVQ
jgi:protein TonB